jgi:hypothetical protein
MYSYAPIALNKTYAAHSVALTRSPLAEPVCMHVCIEDYACVYKEDLCMAIELMRKKQHTNIKVKRSPVAESVCINIHMQHVSIAHTLALHIAKVADTASHSSFASYKIDFANPFPVPAGIKPNDTCFVMLLASLRCMYVR